MFFKIWLSYIYCRVLSIFLTIFILIPEDYGHHTGFIHCSFDWSPNDNHIFDAGLPKNDHILKAQQPILQQNNDVHNNFIGKLTQKTNLWKVNFSCSFVCNLDFEFHWFYCWFWVLLFIKYYLFKLKKS